MRSRETDVPDLFSGWLWASKSISNRGEVTPKTVGFSKVFMRILNDPWEDMKAKRLSNLRILHVLEALWDPFWFPNILTIHPKSRRSRHLKTMGFQKFLSGY